MSFSSGRFGDACDSRFCTKRLNEIRGQGVTKKTKAAMDKAEKVREAMKVGRG
jgi:hypothetical protein